MSWSPVTLENWLNRQKGALDEVRGPVEAIIQEVRARGDAALLDYAEKFDGVRPNAVRISEQERDAAYEAVSPEIAEALSEAYARISRFHELQRRDDLWITETEPGISLGVKTTPLSRVGIYVPGGRASYPSTALMCAIPARVAGVGEIICCTPPPVHPLTIVACDIAGVDEIYQTGGAQAIAAMAYGTESIAPVEKIVGPGNRYVTTAKMMVRDIVEIDFPAGPSEIAIIADEEAQPDFIAADIIAQSEHDPLAASILITPSRNLADEVGTWITRLTAQADRKDIITQSLGRSGYLLVKDLSEAALASNTIAPEHLAIQVKDSLSLLGKIKNAGSIFIGPYTAVACGDYASGTNHVLPTAGNARFYSGLNVAHFTKTSTIQMIDKEGLELIGDIVEMIADAEGLSAHADSVRIRRGTL
ncbi:MAG TPA: histidinol dehydrogenase [Methanospirillum sp.]|uniref:histidinol dehydrogenase n=1 Tax=Methanospirillum sp. TaxID=45200 RepID=UPI002C3D408B|nr:histidinol dehydrogenase [Methanospirillum sp.]HOJ97218.1 histidinol dehydrogenase [Methanospirillum sp.]HPP77990.1 histidinol dehydrogenase [Methanospirillum sp.]